MQQKKSLKNFDLAEKCLVSGAVLILIFGAYGLFKSQSFGNSGVGAVVAEAIEAKGSFQIQRAGSFSWEKIDLNDKTVMFYPGDSLRTGEASVVKVKGQKSAQVIKEKSLVVFRAPTSSQNADFALFETSPLETSSTFLPTAAVEESLSEAPLWKPLKAPLWDYEKTSLNGGLLQWLPSPEQDLANYALEVIAENKVLWRSTTTQRSIHIPDEVQNIISSSLKTARDSAKSAVYVVVRADAKSGVTGAWSAPFVFSEKIETDFLDAVLRSNEVQLQGQKSGEIVCLGKQVQWKISSPIKNGETYEVEYQDQRGLWSEKVTLGSKNEISFCPRMPGIFQIQLKAFSKEELVSQSKKFPLRAVLLPYEEPTVATENRSVAGAAVPPPLEVGNMNLKIENPRDTGVVMTGWTERVWSELHWSHHAEAQEYNLQISPQGAFTGEEKQISLRANLYFTAIENFNFLYWRVRAVGVNGEVGPWTEPRTVRVQAVNPLNPAVPIQSQPHSRRLPGPVLGDASQSFQKKETSPDLLEKASSPRVELP